MRWGTLVQTSKNSPNYYNSLKACEDGWTTFFQNILADVRAVGEGGLSA